MEKKFDLEERPIDFVLILDEIIEQLPNTRLANHLAGQLVRSGSSPALILWRISISRISKRFCT